MSAPWAFRLEGKFGNPFFPLLNNIFRSPQFTTEPLRHLRFIPSGLGEALWRPFAMLDPMYMVHEELMAPDARYAVLCVLICAYAFRWMWKRRAGPAAQLASDARVDTRVLTALGCGFALDWVLWLGGSGNSRYFIPMACVCACAGDRPPAATAAISTEGARLHSRRAGRHAGVPIGLGH